VLQLLTDEDFDGDITRGLLREQDDLDLLRAQDVGLGGAPDASVLAWAAQSGRIVLTHDANTMIGYAYGRIRANQPMPGLIVVGQDVPLRQAIDDLELIAECSDPSEWENRVLHLPL
jgi:hypothetical protein